MKILVLGIGNIIFSDEGIGVHFCRYLQKNYSFKSPLHSIEFIDGGTLASMLIPIIVNYDYVIAVDCISVDNEKPGEVYFFDFENIPNYISWNGSAHEVELLQTLRMMDLAGDRPKTKILGIIPKRIDDTTFILSNDIIQGGKIMEKIFISHLLELGFEVEKIRNLTLQNIADNSCKYSMQ